MTVSCHGRPRQSGVAPFVGRRVDHLARAMHAVGREARSRIGKSLAVENLTVARPRPGLRHRHRKPAARFRQHRGCAGRFSLLDATATDRARGAHSRKRRRRRSARRRTAAHDGGASPSSAPATGAAVARSAPPPAPAGSRRRAIDEQHEGMRPQLVDLARLPQLAVVAPARSARRCRPAAPTPSAPRAPEGENRGRRDRRSSSRESSRRCRAGRRG